MNICANLKCDTVGELANVFQLKGADFVMGRRNCGKKTLTELSAIVNAFSGGPRDEQSAFFDRNEANQNVWEGAPTSKPLGFTAEELLEAIERLQIPHGLPIELVKLPTRIRNWCNSHEWNTLGQLLQNAGGMSLNDFLAVENIGKKSAAEVFGFFNSLSLSRHTELRKFLPLSPISNSVALPEALSDLVASLDSRDLRMLEMRLIDGATLEAIGCQFKCTRELVRQVEDRFLQDVNRILDWFSEERVDLWQVWETTANLAAPLSEKGVVCGLELVSATVSTVFENSMEGKLLQKHWFDTFRSWGRELMTSESFLVEGVGLSEFAIAQGEKALSSRFQAWLEENFGDVVSVNGGRLVISPKELTGEQRTLLFGGEIQEMRWRTLYERLKRYCLKHGNADVPNGWREDRQLAAWVSSQRERRKRGAMPDDEFTLLNELGLTWRSRDVGTWEDRLAEVEAFKQRYGHCEIPTIYPDNPKLGRFVNAMRSQRKRGTLSEERIAKLDAIGFAWFSEKRLRAKPNGEFVSEAWNARFQDLCAYKQRYGDCNVPAKWKQDKRLANWVSMQRQMKKRELLQKARIDLLEGIGIDWRIDCVRRDWSVRYTDLQNFKEQHGHCNVPVRYPDSPSLGIWVVAQRAKRRKGKLSLEQIRLLNDVGFDWRGG